MTKVLVLDAAQRSALAVTRSLGHRGIEVYCAEDRRPTLAGASRYCRRQFVYPSPSQDPKAFLGELKSLLRDQGIDVVFPMTEVSTALLLHHQQEFPGVRIPYRNSVAFDLLTDKAQLVSLAERLGVCVPRSRLVCEPGAAAEAANAIGYPVVVKPFKSQIQADGRFTSAGVHYARDRAELLTLVTVQPYLQKHPFLLQEYVRGTGKGLFALYDRGQAIAFFEHRRIREKPPSGGVSVLSESCAADPVLVANSRRLLDYANWDGVAMVEYKVSDQGVAYLMEVNARFWGSLQLAVDAGVDFPYMLFQSTVGESPQFDGTYRIGIRNRWLLGDLDSLYLRLKSTAGVAGNSRPRWRALADFLNFCDRNTYFEVNRWDDMKPFLVELAAYVGIISR